tara:strand:+ start:290 stop:520 length:231 start_codon:yes stop_codon:yes gene_type:complete
VWFWPVITNHGIEAAGLEIWATSAEASCLLPQENRKIRLFNGGNSNESFDLSPGQPSWNAGFPEKIMYPFPVGVIP